jgi:hypothetical protein
MCISLCTDDVSFPNNTKSPYCTCPLSIHYDANQLTESREQMKTEDFCAANMENKDHHTTTTEQVQNTAANAAATTQNAAKGVVGTAGGILGGAVSAAGRATGTVMQATGSAMKGVGEAVSNLAKHTENTAQGASEHIYKTTGAEEHGKMEANEQVTTLRSQ